MDGAGNLMILFKIIAPLSEAGIATLTMFYAVLRWNEYYRSGIYISKISKVPLQVILRKFVVAGDVTTLVGTQNLMNYNEVAKLDYTALQYATIVVAIIPILLIYPVVLKFYNKDIMAGGGRARLHQSCRYKRRFRPDGDCQAVCEFPAGSGDSAEAGGHRGRGIF